VFTDMACAWASISISNHRYNYEKNQQPMDT
jgi:hypothetical protein